MPKTLDAAHRDRSPPEEMKSDVRVTRYGLRMSSSTAAAVTAIATTVLAVAGTLAFIFAALTWRAQTRQLTVATAETRRLREPVFDGLILRTRPGFYEARLRLRTNEPVWGLQVTLTGTSVDECPFGFLSLLSGRFGLLGPGDPQLGPGDPQLVAAWTEREALLPSDTATWPIGHRQGASNMSAAPDEIHARADCQGNDGARWSVAVTFRLSPEVAASLTRQPLQ